MSQLVGTHKLAAHDHVVIDEIHAIRDQLASVLRPPKRWTGGLRRTSQARAIQGSNSIEGYNVTEQDAAAAVEDEPPLSTDDRTWAEIRAYRRVLTYVVHVGAEPGFEIDESSIRSMHFMLLEHELSRSPGRYRTGPIYVHDEAKGRAVYEGPDPAVVPDLMRSLAASLSSREGDAMVRAAMAHLNLVMIHPFRDGNGRMARALQTMVLAQDQVLEPTFSSIEEWLGHNTQHYYNVLAATGGGAWHPDRDGRLWVKFNLRAHHMQAQTLRRRVAEAESQWALIDTLTSQHGLPERTGDAISLAWSSSAFWSRTGRPAPATTPLVAYFASTWRGSAINARRSRTPTPGSSPRSPQRPRNSGYGKHCSRAARRNPAAPVPTTPTWSSRATAASAAATCELPRRPRAGWRRQRDVRPQVGSDYPLQDPSCRANSIASGSILN